VCVHVCESGVRRKGLSQVTRDVNMSVIAERLSQCIWFMWQDFGSRGIAGVASVRGDQGLPMLVTVSASAVHPNHHRTQLSPSMILVALL